MTLRLYFHPLSSFCHKVLIALYEKGTSFTPELVDLGDATSAAAFKTLWPIGKFPVLRDEKTGRIIPESSIIIEYLDLHHPGGSPLVPTDAKRALDVRFQDRFYDLSVQVPMQKIITDRLRPAGENDRYGVGEAYKLLNVALDIVDREMATKTWAAGEDFSMADCAAAPALFYADMVVPLREGRKNAAAYLERLKQRPSYARALAEAAPYLHLVPR